MMNKSFVVIISIFLINLLVCSISFAVDVPSGFTRDQAISDAALDMAKQQFEQLKVQLQQMAQGLPPDQQAMIEQAIVVVDDKLNRLERIDVYFTRESTPGEAYDSVFAFYQDKLGSIQEVTNEEIEFAIPQVPPELVPQQTMDTLTALVQQGKVKAATGTSGKSRVSISTVYVNPQTFEVLEGTAIVIATDK